LLKRAVIVAILGLSACSNYASGYQRLGLERTETSLVIRYLPCADEEIESARMFKLDSNDVAPDEGDVLIWEISPVDLALLSGPGVVPRAQGVDIPLESGARYFVEVETSRNLVDSWGFASEDLARESVRVDERNVSRGDFENKARDSC